MQHGSALFFLFVLGAFVALSVVVLILRRFYPFVRLFLFFVLMAGQAGFRGGRAWRASSSGTWWGAASGVAVVSGWLLARLAAEWSLLPSDDHGSSAGARAGGHV